MDPARRARRAARLIATATATRDQAIRELHAHGWSLREIADLVGLTHVGVKKIVDRQPTAPTSHP